MCYDIRAESPACRNHERTKKSKMKLNRVKQISIVMAAADVVDTDDLIRDIDHALAEAGFEV